LSWLLQFLSLLQNDLIMDMVVIYADKQIYTALKFGVPVCGHPTIVHVSMITKWLAGAAGCSVVMMRSRFGCRKTLVAHTVLRGRFVLSPAQGGLTSAIFDETFGVLLYAAGRYNHLELEHGVFTARLEVDYKKVRSSSGRIRRMHTSWSAVCPCLGLLGTSLFLVAAAVFFW
jgi:hypothetical protein